ncbi:MAG: EAL domain-containing protein [Actinomycetes bacterium]
MLDPAPSLAHSDQGSGLRAWLHRVPVAVRVLQILLVALLVVYALWVLIFAQQDVKARDLVGSSLVLLLATALLAARAVYDADDRTAWAFFAGGAFIWACADILYSGWISGMSPVPFPAISDWLYLSFYPFAYVGVFLLIRRRIQRTSSHVWLDAAIVALGVAAYVVLAAPAVYVSEGMSPAAVFMSVAIPTSDLVLFCMLAGILSVMGWRANRMLWTMFAGCTLLYVADTFWSFQVGDGSYAMGDVVDIGWPLAFALIALSAWQKQPQKMVPAVGIRAAAAPIAVIALSFLLLVSAAIWHSVPPAPIALAAGAILVGGFRTVQAFRMATVQTEVLRQALTDELTGLANRRHMDQCLAETFGGDAPSTDCPRALLLLDIDSFKEINDSLGHAAGDVVLQKIGVTLANLVRSQDFVARLGGDEFAILLAADTNAEGAVAVAERIRRDMAEPVQIGVVSITVSVSIGIALWPEHAATREELLQKADSAMYRAKRAGCGHVVYDAEADVSERSRLLLIEELRSAIDSGQISCEFQPKIRLADGEVAGAEALVRWHHPTDGLLYPASFLPASEQSGLMARLNDRVLLIALAQAAQWREADLPSRVSVNMSMSAMTDPHLPGRISDLLHRLDLSASSLCVEITETALVSDPTQALEVVCALREIGVIISIDDYGTGYSSLAQLRRLKPQEIKLDKTLISGVSHRQDVRSIVHATVELAHDLGIALVAEGVENSDDLDALQAMGCDLAQGYYICPPGAPAQITEWLRDWTTEGESEEVIPEQREDSPTLSAVQETQVSDEDDETASAARFRRRLRAV